MEAFTLRKGRDVNIKRRTNVQIGDGKRSWLEKGVTEVGQRAREAIFIVPVRLLKPIPPDR